MGWITPAYLDGTVLKPGVTVNLTTPALTRSSAHGVRISTDWCALSTPFVASSSPATCAPRRHCWEHYGACYTPSSAQVCWLQWANASTVRCSLSSTAQQCDSAFHL